MNVELFNTILISFLSLTQGIVNQENFDSDQDDSDFDYQENTFENWKTRFRRNYSSIAEENAAKRNLEKARIEILIHNFRYNAGLETYKTGLWEMSDLSYEEMVQDITGSKVNESYLSLQGRRKKLKSGPDEINWVSRGRVNSVQSQGRCGSCYAFAAVGVIEGVHLKAGMKTRLSVQQIVDCDRGDPLFAMRYAKSNGLARASQYKYELRKKKCKRNVKKLDVKIRSTKKEQLNGNEKRLKDIVANYGPVAVAINAAPSLTNYRSGVYYNRRCSKSINHAVLLVGYGHDKKSKLDYWLVKNSWGSSWGEKGYVRMARNKRSHCGIASEVFYAT
ncbi:CLUMA_CG000600, isoform A [Clunio marinus]|uniref:CLUMA_CG000600, isoform A n=1 Tax=Clunio marinus TaxID=568069 RepID=A0A1J1HFJ6_9DIPT|nr:CLUMA_CG000600, isoform A [Clunio marinus]